MLINIFIDEWSMIFLKFLIAEILWYGLKKLIHNYSTQILIIIIITLIIGICKVPLIYKDLCHNMFLISVFERDFQLALYIFSYYIIIYIIKHIDDF